ncbi:MAG TPA: DUF5689 domain-containing protein [Saprospiraceae bacterium]|nr:DUF5689 domain-containing protein [Saprospiraceae bacterium]
MFKSFLFPIALLVTLGLGLAPISCVDKDFDQPPAGGNDPNLPVNATIAQVKALHTLGAYEAITNDWIISALVVSDDQAGNFYKQLEIQDTSGGIEIRIDISDLHNLYPVGRKVYVKLKGLWLGDYNGLIQLGAGVGTSTTGNPELIRIPESIASQYIITATYGNTVTPKVVTIDQLSLDQVSTLIQLDNVEFIVADAGVAYADAVLQITINRQVEDCAHQKLIVRNSGFATFASQLTPVGAGSIVGILSVFNTDYQLMIRDLKDVDMNGDRCGTGPGGNDINESFTAIADNADVVLDGWANVAVKGTRLWRGKVFSGNHYAQATAFNDSAPEMEAWLITPPIYLDVPKKITFESAYAFLVQDGLTVWISSNFNGINVTSATWTQLFPTIAKMSDAENTFIPSGNIDLSGYSGPVRIGFKYVGNGPGGQTSTFRVDNVKVEKL